MLLLLPKYQTTALLLALTMAAIISHTTAAAPSPFSSSLRLASRQSTQPTITVDLTKTYQTMDGFGFSLAFQRANLITNMSDKTKQRELLDLLFNRTTGAGFSIIRNGIGSSPDSRGDHMNSIAPTNPGGPKAEPSYVWDGKDSGQLWVTQRGVAEYGLGTVYAGLCFFMVFLFPFSVYMYCCPS